MSVMNRQNLDKIWYGYCRTWRTQCVVPASSIRHIGTQTEENNLVVYLTFLEVGNHRHTEYAGLGIFP